MNTHMDYMFVLIPIIAWLGVLSFIFTMGRTAKYKRQFWALAILVRVGWLAAIWWFYPRYANPYSLTLAILTSYTTIMFSIPVVRGYIASLNPMIYIVALQEEMELLSGQSSPDSKKETTCTT